MSHAPLFADATLIHVYARAEALADGVLIDVSETAREVGFKVPVALSAAVWADCVAWDMEHEACPQDEAGRLWDVLWMAALFGSKSPNNPAVKFGMVRVPPGGSRAEFVRLVMHIGPGDQGEPVVTIM